jgi:exopolysaccharide biosynthesis protein
MWLRIVSVAALALTVVATAVLVVRSERGGGADLSGIRLTQISVATPAGRAPLVRLAVRLDDRRYSVEAMATDGLGVSRLDALAAMNGDFYRTDSGVSSGRLVIDGHQVGAGDHREPNLGLDAGRAAIGRDLQGYRDIVSGKPELIADGKAVRRLRLGGVTRSQIFTRAPRSAVALANGELWLVAVGKPGLTLREWQQRLLQMGAGWALNMDGGPSVGLALDGHRLIDQPEPGVPVAIAIVAGRN